MIRKQLVVATCLTVALILNACSEKSDTTNSSSHSQHQTANGDLQESTSSLTTLPSFLNKQRQEITLAYQIAANSVDVLQWIPCYCGCSESAGHKSNQNCFIREIKKDGTVVWDDHGTRCGVCMEIAVKSAQWKQQGKSNKEIRGLIDDAYKKGYAAPTPTPYPV